MDRRAGRAVPAQWSRRLALAGAAAGLLAWASPAAAEQSAAPPPAPAGQVTFYGSPTAAISAGVIIPAGRASLWVSGTTPPVLKADAAAGSRDRYGDTKVQAAGILKAIEQQLTAQGLSMKDVVYIRAYLVADPAKDHKMDLAGWNAAYGEVFGTAANPTKTARSTVGVSALVNADFLIEIEAFAVFPEKK